MILQPTAYKNITSLLDVVSGDHPEEARVNGTEFSEIEYAAINNPDSGTVIVTPGGTLIGQFFYDFELPDDIDTINSFGLTNEGSWEGDPSGISQFAIWNQDSVSAPNIGGGPRTRPQ